MAEDWGISGKILDQAAYHPSQHFPVAERERALVVVSTS